jgi:hypothetical protein
MLCAGTIERVRQKGFSSDVVELGWHSMLIPKIIGEDYVADNWFWCATDGREDREFDRYL